VLKLPHAPGDAEQVALDGAFVLLRSLRADEAVGMSNGGAPVRRSCSSARSG
jgi:hypothetical protein